MNVAELANNALMEVGIMDRPCRPGDTADNHPAGRALWNGHRPDADVISKAASLAAWRLKGPDRLVRCPLHRSPGTQHLCAHITAVEALLGYDCTGERCTQTPGTGSVGVQKTP